MRVADLMQTEVKSITPDAPVHTLVQKLADARVSGLPVVDDASHVIGVVSAGDVLRAAAGFGDANATPAALTRETVRDIMTSDPYVISPDADAREAAKHMLYGDVRRLFVEDQGKLVGVITQTDIAQAVATGRL
jgi:CBS domain-containing protein